MVPRKRPPTRTKAAAKSTAAARAPSDEARLNGFIARFSPEHQVIIRGARRAMRALLAGAIEMVYDNYNFFVIGYGATDRASDAIMSIAAAANGVRLFFLDGAALPDPTGILEGSGRRVRSIRITTVSAFVRPDVRALIAAAVARSRVPFYTRKRGPLIIKSVSKKQRPRRSATSRPARR